MREALRRAQRLAAILLGVAGPAEAAVFVVNVNGNTPTPGGCAAIDRAGPVGDLSTLPACSLPTAVAEANLRDGADEIVINLLGPQRIDLLQTLKVSDDVEINSTPLVGWSGGLLLTSLVIATPIGVDDVLEVSEGETTLRDLRLERGNVLIDPAGSSVTFVQNTGSATFAEDITGAGALEKQGGGTLVLSGTNTFSGGTTIGQGFLVGDTNSIPGGTLADPFDVEDDARLVFDQEDADPDDFFGAISGSGSLEKMGTGTLRLRTPNSYSGGTLVSEGILIGFADGANGSLQGDIDVNNGARLVFEQAADGVFNDDIGGPGRVEKTGPGTLTLLGSNRFGGGLTITQGIVIGSSNSIPGNVSIASSSQLIFDEPDPDGDAIGGTQAGNITGGGGTPPGGFSVIKRGAGVLNLTGTNTYAGGTLVQQGVLMGTTRSLQGLIQMNGAGTGVIFRQDFDGTFAGELTGAGALGKDGNGTLTLIESPTFTPTEPNVLAAGTLVLGVAGQGDEGGTTLPGVLAMMGGTLAGIGRVEGAVAVDTGARISPGAADEFGTLRVGAVGFGAGSTLEVQISNGPGDLLQVDGEAAIDPGASLDVRLSGVPIGSDFTQDVLTAASVTGGPFLDPEDLFFFTLAVVQDGDSVAIDVTPTDNALTDPEVANTRNKLAVATALTEAQAVAPPGSDLDDVFDSLGELTGPEISDALDEMHGEQLTGFPNTRLAIADRFTTSLHERIRGVAWSDSETLLAEQTREAGPVLAGDPVLQRALPGVVQGFAQSDSFPTWFGAQSMSTVLDSGTSFQPLQGEHGMGGWIDGYGIFGALDGDADASDLDYIVGGFSLGVDYLVAKNVLIGAAGGYAYSTLDYDHLSGNATSNTGQGALYAGYVTPWLRLGASGRFGYSAMETSRHIDFIGRSADGDFSGWDGGARAEAALDLFKLGFVEVQPLASFSYTHLEQDSFEESGADSLDLDVDEQTIDSLVSGVGARFHGLLQMDETLWFHPELHATWLHEFGDRERELDERIGGTPGAVFTVRGAKPAADVGVLGARWTVVSAGRLHVFADYDVALSSNLIQQGVSAGFKVVW